MQEIYQKTVSQNISFSGIGLQSGIVYKVRILPAKENSGIIFKRNDLEKNNIVPANYKNVSSARLCTTLTNEFGVSVSTVEHVLSALTGLGIDNCLVEVNAQEMPIMDGSAQPFVKVLQEAGIKDLQIPKNYFVITEPIKYVNKEKGIR